MFPGTVPTTGKHTSGSAQVSYQSADIILEAE